MLTELQQFFFINNVSEINTLFNIMRSLLQNFGFMKNKNLVQTLVMGFCLQAVKFTVWFVLLIRRNQSKATEKHLECRTW